MQEQYSNFPKGVQLSAAQISKPNYEWKILYIIGIAYKDVKVSNNQVAIISDHCD